MKIRIRTGKKNTPAVKQAEHITANKDNSLTNNEEQHLKAEIKEISLAGLIKNRSLLTKNIKIDNNNIIQEMKEE